MNFPRISSLSDSVYLDGSSALLTFARNESRQLIDGLSLGMPRAEGELVQQFTAPLIRYIRPRIDSRFQHRFTAEDIVQSAFLSFFKRHRKSPYQFEDERNIDPGSIRPGPNSVPDYFTDHRFSRLPSMEEFYTYRVLNIKQFNP